MIFENTKGTVILNIEIVSVCNGCRNGAVLRKFEFSKCLPRDLFLSKLDDRTVNAPLFISEFLLKR